MLDANLKAQLQAYLERLVNPIELIASLDDSQAAQELHQLLQEIADLNAKIRLAEPVSGERQPSFAIARVGETPRVRFAGIPLGHEFTSLLMLRRVFRNLLFC